LNSFGSRSGGNIKYVSKLKKYPLKNIQNWNQNFEGKHAVNWKKSKAFRKIFLANFLYFK
jgi:hypothetical protein